MEEKTFKNIEESLNDVHSRAWACEADSEDYFRYLKQEEEYAKILLEREKILIEREKSQKEVDDDRKKFLISMAKDLLMLIVTFKLQQSMLREHRRETMLFEKEGVWTTQAGKANSNGFKLFGGNKGLL